MQMPPKRGLRGHVRIGGSQASALRGLARRRATLVGIGPRGAAAPTRAALRGRGALILSRSTFFAFGISAAPARAAAPVRSELPLRGAGANCEGGPSGFGESAA